MTDELNDNAGAAGEGGGSGRFTRRDALKKGAIGAGVVGVVWAAPEIVGLATAPAFGATGSGGGVSNVPCSGDVTFDLKIVCPPGGHGGTTVQVPGGNCPPQGINVDSHWANAQPTDVHADLPTKFNDVTPQDTGPWKHYRKTTDPNVNTASFDLSNSPQFLVAGIHRANVHCSFTAAAFNGTNGFLFNPVNKAKFSGAFQTASDVSVGWASDPNERADLGAPACDGTFAHLTMHCV